MLDGCWWGGDENEATTLCRADDGLLGILGGMAVVWQQWFG